MSGYISIAGAKGLDVVSPQAAALEKFEAEQAANPEVNQVNASQAARFEQAEKGRIIVKTDV